MIDLPPRDLTTIKRVLAKHVPDCEVRAFGSRVTWTAKPHSDLDLVVLGKDKLPRSLLSTLKGEFEDSAMPVTVDLLDWHRISPEFQKNIAKQYETIQHPHEGKSIPQGWDYRKVAAIAEVIGGGTPKTKKDEYWGGDIPWLTPKDLSGEHPRYVSHGERNITKAGLENSSARIVPAKTVLLTSRAPVGYVAMARNPITTNQGFRSLVVNDDNDPEFVYYLLLNNTDYLKQHAAGSTFQELSGSTLKSLEFLMPPLPEQKAIAHILGTLDDKIELNRRINETLEGIARAIFKSWFVDFDPVHAKAEGRETGLPKEIEALFPDGFEVSELGVIPKGWTEGTLAELTELNPETWKPATAPEHIIYVDLANTKNGVINSTQDYSFRDAPSRARRVLRSGDTIVGTVRPGNRSFAYVSIDGLTGSTGFAVLRPKRNAAREFVYLCATQKDSIDHLAHLADGAAYPAVRPDVVLSLECTVPASEVLAAFHAAVAPLFAGMGRNVECSQSLDAAKYHLLPALLSGRVPVPLTQEAAL